MSERTLRDARVEDRSHRDRLKRDVDAKVRELRPWVPDWLFTRDDGVCPICDTEFPVTVRAGVEKVFCSEPCRKRANNHRDRMERAA